MSKQLPLGQRFKQRLLAQEPLLGTFIKTPHPIIIEVLAQCSLDFVVLDAEHAPFDRHSLDLCIMTARAHDLAVLVRVPNPDWILNTLDCGACGILVPHVIDAEQAASLVRLCRYGPGGRGFAGTTRAAAYGRRPLSEHREQSADEVSLICQIEDPEALANAAAIGKVEGVDALFVGRADLAVAQGYQSLAANEITKQCQAVLGHAHHRRGQLASGLFCPMNDDLALWQQAGASLFVIGSEHSFLQQATAELAARFTQQTQSRSAQQGH